MNLFIGIRHRLVAPDLFADQNRLPSTETDILRILAIFRDPLLCNKDTAIMQTGASVGGQRRSGVRQWGTGNAGPEARPLRDRKVVRDLCWSCAIFDLA